MIAVFDDFLQTLDRFKLGGFGIELLNRFSNHFAIIIAKREVNLTIGKNNFPPAHPRNASYRETHYKGFDIYPGFVELSSIAAIVFQLVFESIQVPGASPRFSFAHP